MRRSLHTYRGFTIVELLIVVVVIAILAAITIVAYNGINDRAKASSAISATQQAAKKVMAHAVTNADQYPSSLASIGVMDTGGTTYQYRAENNSSPKTFCLTATTSGRSYYVTHSNPTPAEGTCPSLITNRATNPSVETDPWVSCALCTQTRIPGSLAGSYVARVQVGTAGSSYLYIGAGANVPVTAGETVSASAIVRNVTGGTRPFSLSIVWRDASNNGIPNQVNGSSQSIAVGSTATLTVTGTAPAGVAHMQIQGRSTSAQVSDVYEWDGVMIVSGSTVSPYADGNTPEWIWNGTPNNSSSTGTPL